MSDWNDRVRTRDDGPVGNALAALYFLTAGASVLALVAGSVTGKFRLAIVVAIPMLAISIGLAVVYLAKYGAANPDEIEVGEVVR